MKKFAYILLSALLVLGTIAGAAACGKKDKITIAVPNDTTNEARALLLLEDLGLITLKDGAGITATARDIKDNPYNIEIKEIEAAQIPNVRKDVDLAIINSNYAIEAGLNPVKAFRPIGPETDAAAAGRPKSLALRLPFALTCRSGQRAAPLLGGPCCT